MDEGEEALASRSSEFRSYDGESAAKEKEQKDAVRALEQIEAKAKRSYQKDVASFEARDSSAQALDDKLNKMDQQLPLVALLVKFDAEWEYDSSSGYYYNQNNGLCYDPKSGFYYSDAIEGMPQAGAGAAADSKSVAKSQNDTAPGLVLSATLNPMRSVKGAQSSVAVKRKRQDEKQLKAVSKEEAAALKAREAAKKTVEERETVARLV
ncbi:pentatricopeptide repeat-containing protein [Hibiscus syriacus]|uniref:Pentatricopeptide repeat-containing protein n=1 Tax=Hibiscus syriacus TaxID=106335 RepID=A0A6A3C184_HIBSY|nr:pentatricopeptide repeat-containing protein [Hibiscus syriacus]